MNEKIMKFSAQYFYENKLIAHETVKNQSLKEIISLSKITNIQRISELDHNLTTNPFIFIDTSKSGLYEDVDSNLKSKMNDLESIICMNLISKLTSLQIKSKDIGIITPYASQVNLLLKKIKDSKIKDVKEIEVETVDGFQGREKEVIILSLVRSNEHGEIGFVKDKNRMNVAITRAKRCVIIIIDTKTFFDYDSYFRPWERFIFTFCTFLYDNAYILPMEKIITKDQIEKIKNDINTRKIQSIYSSSSYVSYNGQKPLVTNYAFNENHYNLKIKNYLPNFHEIVKQNFRDIIVKNQQLNGYSAPHFNPILNTSNINSNQQTSFQFFPHNIENIKSNRHNLINNNNKTTLNLSASVYLPKSMLKSNKKQSENQSNQAISNIKLNEETLSKIVIDEKKENKSNLAVLLKNEKQNVDEESKNKTNGFQNINKINNLTQDQNFVIKSHTNSASFTYKPRFIKEIKKDDINTVDIELLKKNSKNLTVFKNDIQILLENDSKNNLINKKNNKKQKKLEKNIKKIQRKNQLYLFMNNNPNICIPISDFKKKFFVHDIAKIENYKKKNEEILNNLKRRQEEEIEKFLKNQLSNNNNDFEKENESFIQEENQNEVEYCEENHDSIENYSQKSNSKSISIKKIIENNKQINNSHLENNNDYEEENSICKKESENTFNENDDNNVKRLDNCDNEDCDIYENESKENNQDDSEINEKGSEESDYFENGNIKYFYFCIADSFFEKYVNYLKNKRKNKEGLRVFNIYFSFNYFNKKYELLEEESFYLKSLKTKLDSKNIVINCLKLEHLNYAKENIIFLSEYIPTMRYMTKILNENVIAFDSEWTNEKKGTSIFQISTQDKFTYIFDLNVFSDGEKPNSQRLERLFMNFFYKLFLSESVIKIGWDFRNDIHCLKKKFPDIFNKTECINSMLDLMEFRGKGIPKGLSGYCNKHLGYPLDKTYQMSDWDKRPLSQEQLIYAALDSIACLEIFEKLKETVKFENKKFRIKN